MKITFCCESCRSEFTVDAQLAGRSGRCKRCNARFIVPSVDVGKGESPALKLASMTTPAIVGQRSSMPARSTTAATGHGKGGLPGGPDGLIDRLTSSFKLKPASEEPLRLAQPKSAGSSSKPSSPQRAAGWLNAVNSQIALKPVSLENLGSLRQLQELEPDSIAYQPAAADLKRLRKKSKSDRAGLFVQSYDQFFRNAAKLFRWINEAAYGISILFMILAIVGYVMQLTTDSGTGKNSSSNTAQNSDFAGIPGAKALPLPNHPLITLGVSGIVLLNLVRLGAGLANLIAIPFRKSLIEGILFLIPPMTFLYIAQNWKRMQKPVGRILGPVFALSLVVAAYAVIPTLGKGRHPRGDLLNRVNNAVNTLQKDVGGSVQQLQNKVETLQNKFPSQIENAKQAVEGLKGQVQQAVDNLPVPDNKDTPKKD